MKKIIVFRNDLLYRSETFIKAQVLSLAHWHPILVGYQTVTDGLDLNGLDTRLAPGLTAGPWQRRNVRLRQWLGTAHPPTVQVLRSIGAGLIHVHFGTDAVDIWPSVRKLGVPLLVTLHGYDINVRRNWWETGHGGARQVLYPRRLLKLAAQPHVHFIAVSNAVRERAIAFGIPADKLTTSYIGVDVKCFQPGPIPLTERSKRILFVGRLVEKKGIEYLIRAFAKVTEFHPDAQLNIAGDGPLYGSLQTLSNSLGINVTFLGSLTSEHVKEEMQRARIFCLPSIAAANGDAEGLPIVLLEAGACGIPAVTSARGGNAEAVLDSKTGYCFPEKDVGTLANKLSALLSDDVTLIRLGLAAREHIARNFDIVECTQNLERIYDRVDQKMPIGGSIIERAK